MLRKLYAAAAIGAATTLLTLATAPAWATGGHGHTPVEVCHKGRSIVVDDSAVPGHLRHGDTLGACPKPTPTSTPTPSPTVEPTPDPTPDPTPKPTQPTPEPTQPTPSETPTVDPTPTPEPTPTPTETATPDPTPEPTPSVTGTPSPEPTPSETATPDPTPTPEPTPSETTTPDPEPTPTETPSPTPTPSPTATELIYTHELCEGGGGPYLTQSPEPTTPQPTETETVWVYDDGACPPVAIDTGSVDELAYTGSDTWPLLAAGGLLIAVGVALAIATQKGRHS